MMRNLFICLAPHSNISQENLASWSAHDMQTFFIDLWLLKAYGDMPDCPYSVMIRCILGSSRIAFIKEIGLRILTRDSICKYSYASGLLFKKTTSRNRLTL